MRKDGAWGTLVSSLRGKLQKWYPLMVSCRQEKKERGKWRGHPPAKLGCLPVNPMVEEQFSEIAQLYKAGRKEEALLLLRSLADSTPEIEYKLDLMLCEVGWLSLLGRVREARGRFEVAAALMQETKIIPQQADFRQGDLLYAEGRHKEALEVFDELLEIYFPVKDKPGFLDIYEEIQHHRGIILARLRRYREALPLLEEVTSFSIHKGEDFYFCYGASLLMEGRVELAKSAFLQALQLGDIPQYEVSIHYYLGQVYMKLGAYAQALKEFEICEQRSDEAAFQKRHLYRRLAATCKALGLQRQAQDYENLAKRERMKTDDPQ